MINNIYFDRNYNFSGIIVLITDFGTSDGSVNELKGVIHSVKKSLLIVDLTHDIAPFNIFEAAYRLYQTALFWPKGTVFVSVVDPGVGTERKSVILKSKTGHYFISPDNGTLTLINKFFGAEQIIEINENKNIMPEANSYTSHGRDLYCYLAAKLISNQIALPEIGKAIPNIIQFSYPNPTLKDNDKLTGIIAIHDRYGNVWTNIDLKLIHQFNFKEGAKYKIYIIYEAKNFQKIEATYVKTFANIAKDDTILYINSVSCLALGINLGSIATKYRIGFGLNWQIKIFAK